MEPSDRGTSPTSRRGFLRYAGTSAVLGSLAGCGSVTTPSGETDTSPNGGEQTATTTGRTQGGGAGTTVYAIDPPGVVEGARDEVRAVFLEAYHTRVETPVEGLDAPTHVVSYGHDAGATENDRSGIPSLAAGVVTTPESVDDGENSLASAPLADLVSGESGGLFLQAVGLGADAEMLTDPVQVERSEETALDQTTEAKAYLVALSNPESQLGGVGGPPPGVGLATVYASRVVVGGTVALVGMVDGWRRPPSMTPKRVDVGPEMMDVISDAYDAAIEAALFAESLGRLGRLGIDEDNMPPPPEEKYETVTLDSPPVGVTEQGQRDAGYPTEASASLYDPVSYVVGRDEWSIGSWDEDTFDEGTKYDYKVEALGRAYPLSGDDTYPVGLITSPRLERHGKERNPLVNGDLTDVEPFLSFVADEFDVFEKKGYVDWSTRPSKRSQPSNQQIIGESAKVEVFGGTLTRTTDSGSWDKQVELVVARALSVDEVIIAATVRVETGNSYWDDRQTHLDLFDLVLDRLNVGVSAPSGLTDVDVEDLRLVQTVSNTRAEKPDGTVIDSVDDPDLIAGENVAPVFDVRTPAVTTSSVTRFDLPKYLLLEGDVKNRSNAVVSAPGRMNLISLANPDSDPEAIFTNLAADGVAENDPIVFPVAKNHNSVTVHAKAPSGHRFGTDTVAKGTDYDIADVDPLSVGFITVKDPGDGKHYGDSNGRAASYSKTVEMSVQYLERTFPGPLYVYRHDGTPLKGHHKGAFGRGDYLDYGDAQSTLEKEAQKASFPSNGTVWADGGSKTAAKQHVSSTGFDVWVLVVPVDYYTHHGHSKNLLGLEPGRADHAVSVVEAKRSGFSNRAAAANVAHEICHRFTDQPYDAPGPNGTYPYGQRDDKGEDVNVSGKNGKDVDLDHARIQKSNLDSETGTDGPGVLSEAYDLTDGTFRHVESFTLNPSTSTAKPFALQNSGGMTKGSMPSFMAYRSPTTAAWTDGVAYRQLVDSNWESVKLLESIFSMTATTSNDGTVEVTSMRSFTGKSLTEDVDGGTVLVEFLDPNGETLASRRLTDSVEVTDAEDVSNVVSFQFVFPQTAATLRVTNEGVETDENPIVGVLRDAVDRLPDTALVGDPADVRGTFASVLDSVTTAMSDGDYAGAVDRIPAFSSHASELVRADYEAYANQPTRSELLRLCERMTARLSAIAEANTSGGESGDTTGRWTSFQRDLANTGHDPDPVGPTANVDERWRTKIESNSLSSPAVGDGTVYLGDDAGTVYALNASDGSTEWTAEADGVVRSAPALAGDRVYVTTRRGTLFAFAAGTGEEVWRTETPGSIDNLPAATSSPAVVGDAVYFANPTGTLYAVGLDGEIRWEYGLDGSVYSSPAVVDGVVYAADTEGTVAAVDAADGSRIWAATASAGVSSSPTVANGQVYVGTDGATVEAFDAVEGTHAWTFEAEAHFFVSSPAVTDDTLFVGSGGSPETVDVGHVHAIDAATGEERWHFETGDHVLSSPAVTGDTVFVGSGDANVYALDADDGSEVWRFDTGGEAPVFDDVSSSPAVVDGTVYVAALSSRTAAHAFALDGDTP